MPGFPSYKTNRMGFLVLMVTIVAAVVLVIPPALAGGAMVPVGKVVFSETTGSLSATGANASFQSVSAYEYYFSTRAGGMIRTTDTSVSTANGNATLTMDLKLTDPTGQTTDLGTTSISGGLGTRTHTVYLSIDQGVRAPGSYVVHVDLTAKVTVGGVLKTGYSASVSATFTVS